MSNPGHDPDDGWGKLNSGQVYVILATDILRALAFANLGKHELILMSIAIERSWGAATRRARRGEPWPDPKPFDCQARQLGRELAIPFQRLQEAKTRLIKARILREVSGGILIEKRANRWLDPRTGNPLLNPAELALCYACRTRSLKHEMVTEESSMVAESTDKLSRSGVTGCNAPPLRSVTPERYACNPAALHPVTPERDTPIEERARPRARNSEHNSEHNTAQQTRGAAADAPFPEDQDRAPTPSPDPVLSGAQPSSDPKLVALVAWGEKALADAGADEFTVDDFSRAVGLWLSGHYRPAVVKAAVEKAIAAGAISGNRFIPFVHGFLAKDAARSKPLPDAPKPRPEAYNRSPRPRFPLNGKPEPERGAR